MQNRAFHRLLSQLKKLTPTQTTQLQNHIKQKCSIKTIEDTTGVADNCPHCGLTIFYKWGVRAGLQRYKCRASNKTFNTLTKTPLARLRDKEVWKKYAQDLINGITTEKVLNTAK